MTLDLETFDRFFLDRLCRLARAQDSMDAPADRYTLPEPRTNAEKAALAAFVRLTEAERGAPVDIVYPTPAPPKIKKKRKNRAVQKGPAKTAAEKEALALFKKLVEAKAAELEAQKIKDTFSPNQARSNPPRS